MDKQATSEALDDVKSLEDFAEDAYDDTHPMKSNQIWNTESELVISHDVGQNLEITDDHFSLIGTLETDETNLLHEYAGYK
jgi:hypothetical protein